MATIRVSVSGHQGAPEQGAVNGPGGRKARNISLHNSRKASRPIFFDERRHRYAQDCSEASLSSRLGCRPFPLSVALRKGPGISKHPGTGPSCWLSVGLAVCVCTEVLVLGRPGAWGHRPGYAGEEVELASDLLLVCLCGGAAFPSFRWSATRDRDDFDSGAAQRELVMGAIFPL